jgi:type VI secretion system protein ImpE
MALRAAAWDACPGLSGQIDGRPFDWLSDADPRLGASFELFCAQGYVWVPYENCEFVEFPPTEVWLDLVWRPVKCQLSRGDLVEGFMPVRYPGTELSGDEELCLARRTEWREQPSGGQFPVGQRLFVWGEGDAPMLECRRIEFMRPASEK